MNQSLTLIFLIAAGVGLVVQNSIMVRITQTSSTILIAMLLNSLVGIVLFVTILWFKPRRCGLRRAGRQRALVDIDPRSAGVIFCICQH